MVKKYFIAIVIPGPAGAQIGEIKRELFDNYGLKGALRSPAHITLHRPFEWKEEKEQELIAKLEQFRFDRSFAITLKDFAFFEPRVIYVNVLPNEPLTALHAQLMRFARRELKLFNEVEDERGFHAHVTVAFRDLKKPLFYELQKQFQTRPFSGSFTAGHFSLLKLHQQWEVLRDFDFRSA